ncbi:2Fe-2S iron-sulfur cluster-binding protein [Millisia brevis]|uniref:2Fe-2S iron-sulfur cluster-binding protein n=1 Tax=Millisia brevis TaxID=264148 RepID=UPI000830D886|nr:2Fe-2S iron-sulfur cluster-binding protein [Millisia brevis]
MTELRTPSGGTVDRTAPIEFVFDGQTYTGYRGDTLASALLANGIHRITTSVNLGRPRGITGSGAEDATAQVGIDAPFIEPMVPATTIELCPGLVAHGVPGWGRLSDEPDRARYDALHHHAEILVVGAGPAGLAAAVTAARTGVRVILVDDRPQPGGAQVDSAVVTDLVAQFDAQPNALRLQRTVAFGAYDDGLVLAVENRTDHLGTAAPQQISRQRVHRIRARGLILATGAHERPIVFANNDLPGILLAGAAGEYLERYGVLPGARGVVFAGDDSAYAAAFALADAGVTIAALVDPRPEVSADLAAAAADRSIPLYPNARVLRAAGTDRVEAVTLDTGDEISCDHVLVSGGWNPAVHLASQLRATLRWDDDLHAFVPDTLPAATRVVGAAAGHPGVGPGITDGAAAAADLLTELGIDPVDGPALPTVTDRPAAAPTSLWRASTDPADEALSFVDLQRDATVADIVRAIGAGMRSVEHVKRYTTIGTAHDQGKTSGVVTAGIVAELLGSPIGAVGVTTFRPPYTPVSFATLAGSYRGDLFDPVRITAVHDWHVARGAVFEDVGQWKRPRYYPRSGEDMNAAVLRECAAVRSGVGILDGSTLGKIDVAGPDAPILLDRLYTNMMSSLGVGKVRYGVMCGADGMVIDDGTVMRLAPDRYLVFTTTGGAAAILEWMEEWLQTEWPELRVRLTSQTEHWCTFPVVGPRSREVIGAIADDLDVSNDAFGFMTWQNTSILGVPARIARISFSGELAYEVNVPATYGRAVWEAIIAAGEPYGITPYGTETMHVLRAEKGYPIIGQDTDGTVTPQDLGMAWVVSKKKPDFVGKRSLQRPLATAPDRKQLVGLVPVDRSTVLPEGSQVIDHRPDRVLPPPPVPMLGHVTSSYRSAELGHPFALALISGGRERIGERLDVPIGGRLLEVEVTGTVFVDPEGERRDG